MYVSLADTPVVGSADAFRQWNASGQTGTASDELDLSLLGEELTLGGATVPLLSNGGNGGLLDLGSLGALTSFADSPYQSQSTASSGILGDNGSIVLNPSDVPSTFAPATLDLTGLLGEVPLIDQTVLDAAGLEIGALGSTAAATAGVEAPATDYMVAGAKLNVDSPLVGNVASTLQTTVTGLGSTLNSAVGSDGVLGQAVAGLPDINIGLLRLNLSGGTAGLDGVDAALAAAATTLLDTPLEDSNKIVSINLADGTITVDLAKVVDGGDLNALDPNTELLDADTLTSITAAVTEALTSLTSKVTTAVTDVVNNLSVTLTLPVQLSALGVLGVADETITVKASLGQLTGAVSGTPTVTITNNNPSVIGLILGLLGVDDLLGYISQGVVGQLVTSLQPVVNGLLTTVGAGLSDTLDPVINSTVGSLSPVLNALNQLVSARVNEQPTAAPLNGEGDFGAGSTTVRALAVTLLPSGASGAARIEFASSTVKHRFDAPAPGDANTNASASASASSTANGDNDASATAAAQAAAMADNSSSASADSDASAQAAASTAATSDASSDASTNATGSAQAAASGSNDSTADSASNASGSTTGDSDAGAASEAAAQADASTNASANAAGTSNASANTSSSASSDANVNASASAAADAQGNPAAQAAALADATTTASAASDSDSTAAASSAANASASTNASSDSSGAAANVSAQAAANTTGDDDTNANASTATNANASAAASSAATSDSSTNASQNAQSNTTTNANSNATTNTNANASTNTSGNANASGPGPDPMDCKVSPERSPFTDNSPSKNPKFYDEIEWMWCMGYSTGILQPDGSKIYGPQMRLSREAMAAFIYRMEAPKNYQAPTRSPFLDMKPGDKFYKEIAWMYESGLSTGIKTDAGIIYGPKLRLSREAMAAFIYRLEDPKGYQPPAKSKMADMHRGDKFYTEINWMVDEGLSTGIGVENGKREYWPKSRLSREAMAAFIYRLQTDYRQVV